MAGTIAAGIAGAVISAAYYHYRYEPRHSLYSAVIDLLRDPDTRDVALYGVGPTPGALGRFLWNKSGEGHLFVTNLPSAPTGKMYAVWTIASQSPPLYVASVSTDASGRGGVHISAADRSHGIGIETVVVSRSQRAAPRCARSSRFKRSNRLK
jgi:hypothetical protein